MDRPNYEDSTADGGVDSEGVETVIGEAYFGADDGEIVGAVTGSGQSTGIVFGTRNDLEGDEDGAT